MPGLNRNVMQRAPGELSSASSGHGGNVPNGDRHASDSLEHGSLPMRKSLV